MLAKTLICINCGHEGEIEVPGSSSDVPPSKIFRHLGHNPFSGHMHYQCPACDIVLLIDPLSILGGRPSFHYQGPLRRSREKEQTPQVPQVLSLFQKIFQGLQTGN